MLGPVVTRRGFAALAVSAVLVGGFGLAATPAHAADISGEARGFVEKMAQQAIDTISNPALGEAERLSKFRALLTEGFDVPAIARFTLGRYWRVATDAQKAEFLTVFEQLIIDTYSTRFKEYKGEKLTILGSRNEDSDHATVQTQIVDPAGGSQPVKIEWRVLKPGGQLKIVDVLVEGVSMSVTQQQEFASAIQRNGGDVGQFIAQLKEKVGKPS